MPGEEPDESKLTKSGASPLMGVAVATAVGLPSGMVVVVVVVDVVVVDVVDVVGVGTS